MIAVIFELTPKPGKADAYFSIAGNLKPFVEKIDGFISVERFQSVTNPGKYLSLSFWSNEEAVKKWRNLFEHRETQKQGRSQVFDDYCLRVAQITRDYGMNEREQRPLDSSVVD